MSTSQQRGQGWRMREESRSQDSRPVPDPTVLTTAASVRLEETLRGLIKTEIAHVGELFDEKLGRVDVQFHDLVQRTAEQKKDTKDALDAALAAQKEQVSTQNLSFEKNIAKSETATIERIKALETLLQTSNGASDGKISDLKDRVIALEAVKLGVSEGAASVRQTGTDSRNVLLAVIACVSVLISLASLVVVLTKL